MSNVVLLEMGPLKIVSNFQLSTESENDAQVVILSCRS